MTVLDVLTRYRQTVTVFKRYDEHAGTCICCESLFESLENVAAKHALNLKDLLIELETIANEHE
jgi:hypothetical protein